MNKLFTPNLEIAFDYYWEDHGQEFEQWIVGLIKE